jgi:hypothetical protein
MKKINTLLFVLIAACSTVAQNSKDRLQAGRLYAAGETLYAPRLGFITKVPEDWQGVLPRETEVFMLTTTNTSIYGEIYMFGKEQGDLKTMRESWIKGFDLTETMRLKASNPTLTEGTLSSEVVAVGESINEGYRAFAIARCNPDGPCVTLLALMPKQFYEEIYKVATEVMAKSTFETPSNVSPYANFNWRKFLSDKQFFAYAYVEGASKDNRVQLCADGTFTSDIQKKGWMKNENQQYNGRNSGHWIVDGVGDQTTMHLTFKKKDVPPMDIVLSIKDEKIFANGERYFVGESKKCK